MRSTLRPASDPSTLATLSFEESTAEQKYSHDVKKEEGKGCYKEQGESFSTPRVAVDPGWRHAAVNDNGRVIGEHHHRAKFTDADVELIHELRAAGLSYGQIAAKFDDGLRIGKQTVADICNGRRRGQTVMGHKKVSKRPDFMPADLDEFDIVGGF